MQRHYFLAFVAISFVVAPTWVQSNEKPLEFDVASVRRVEPDIRSMRNSLSEGRLTATNVTLRMLIENAFDLKPFQLTGGPKWMDSDRFTVMAQTDPSATNAQVKRMSQSLFKERFRLTMHSEIKEQSIYALQIKDKAKLKLQPAQEGGSSGLAISTGGMADPVVTYRFHKYTMERLADMLSRETQRLVKDETGVSGEFDFEIKGTRDPDEKNPFAIQLAPIISDLGLRLDGQKGSVDFFVIDRGEHPTEN